MRMRDRDESHRVSTPLELLFDLCFVVAVSTLASHLHDGLAAGHTRSALFAFAGYFMPVWWASMAYTWYATAFDNDDVPFRLLTLSQMAGVLVLSAALPSSPGESSTAFGFTFVAMRAPMVFLWLRAAKWDDSHRRFALRYAAGTVAAMCVWSLGLAFGVPARFAVWSAAMVVELLTPMAATRVAPGRVFHTGHIAERYGLFTLIVLGESILAVSMGLRALVSEGSISAATVIVSASTLVVAFSVWWIYFDTLGRQALERHRRAAFVWGYGHALLYGSIAAVGSGAQLLLDATGSHHSVMPFTIATALVFVSLAWLQFAANVQTRSAVILFVAGTVQIAVGILFRHSAIGTGIATAAVCTIVVLHEALSQQGSM
ncbi:MAG: hypothetical protein RLZZ554_697 [Actinomycetota bacterium]